MKNTPNYTNNIKRRTSETGPLSWLDVDYNFQYANFWISGKTYKQGMKVSWNDYLGLPFNTNGQMSEWICTADHISNNSNPPGSISGYWERITFISDLTLYHGTITLGATSWSGNSITVGATGVTTTNFVTIGAPLSRSQYLAYGAAGISCIAQNTDSLTFTCTVIPDIDIVLNIKIES